MKGVALTFDSEAPGLARRDLTVDEMQDIADAIELFMHEVIDDWAMATDVDPAAQLARLIDLHKMLGPRRDGSGPEMPTAWPPP